MTITTYYPSPYGSYNQLYVVDKLGIGTTSPSAKLEIYSDTTAAKFRQTDSGDMLKINPNPAGSGVTLNVVSNSESTFEPMFFGAKKYGFYTSSGGVSVGVNYYSEAAPSNGMIIEGNVGIGTTGPAGKLDVNGTIYQRGSLLHADYVFEPGYELEPIEEHSQYMWANQHLKAVPKAQKDESGQDMVEYGAHNRGVLEELEKAHVYIQQLNERIKALEIKLSKLKG